MKGFYERLREDIAEYEGRHDEFIYLAPEWYRFLTNLMEHPRLPSRLKPLVCCAIAYFILPADVISEEVEGPYGYVDDIFFSAYVARELLRRGAEAELLAEAWEGEGEISELIPEILARETDLIGDNASAIFEYTGFSELLSLLDGGPRPG